MPLGWEGLGGFVIPPFHLLQRQIFFPLLLKKSWWGFQSHSMERKSRFPLGQQPVQDLMTWRRGTRCLVTDTNKKRTKRFALMWHWLLSWVLLTPEFAEVPNFLSIHTTERVLGQICYPWLPQKQVWYTGVWHWYTTVPLPHWRSVGGPWLSPEWTHPLPVLPSSSRSGHRAADGQRT